MPTVLTLKAKATASDAVATTEHAAPLFRCLPDVLGLGWVMAAAMLMLTPAFARGGYLGPFDTLSTLGLTAQRGVIAHNTAFSDQITAMIPWTHLAWLQVHSGHVPLWNPYNGVGVPLAFNWQSAVFSVPSLIAYVFPLQWAFTVVVVTTILIAGSGAYVLGRVLHLGVIASAFAATIFELSGPMVAWLGYPMVTVMAWSGWIFAAAILLTRASHRVRYIVLLSVFIACAVYSGHPQALFLLGTGLIVFLVVLLAMRTSWLGGSGPILRPTLDLVMAAVAGAFLSAPLILPGLQIIGASARSATSDSGGGVSLFSLPNLLMQGYYGLPIAGSHWFPPGSASALYSESAAYLGVVALVLAGAVMVVHIRKPMAAAFTAVAAAMAFAAFFGLGIVPIHLVALASGSYALMPMSFALAMLAGIGLNILISRNTDRRYLKWAGVGFGVVLALLLGLWALGSHRRNPLSGGQLSSAEASIRAHSFVGPVLCTVIGLAAVGIILRYGRRPAAAGAAERPWPLGGIAQWTGMALLVVESVFLIAAGAPLWPSNASFPAPTAAETALQQTVGSALVGVGSGGCSAYSWDLIGIVANDNILPGIRELSIYDPAAPSSYFTSWWAATGSHQLKYSNWFCPNVTTSQVARLYGVSYVLEVHDQPGPTGSVFVKSVGDEDLFRIPGASTATMVPLQAGGPPDKFVPGKPVPSTRPAPNQLRVSMDSSSAQVLRLREANVPGWKASIDGKPLALHKFAGLMLEATIPAGHHVIELTYWPPLFTAGLVLALLTVIGLVAALVVAGVRPRHARR